MNFDYFYDDTFGGDLNKDLVPVKFAIRYNNHIKKEFFKINHKDLQELIMLLGAKTWECCPGKTKAFLFFSAS